MFKKEIPLWNSLDIAIAMTRYGGFGAVPRGTMIDDSLAQHKPKAPHYFLFAIGTRPAFQKQGKGSKLMEAGLVQADAEGMPAYLESSKASNVPFYEKFGFEVTRKIDPGRDCPPLWLMWREPR